MARVRMEQLTKVFPGSVVAVDHLNLDVPEGTFLSLVGPSGCGKTTTLRMLAGLETPTRGHVWFGSRRMDGVPAQLRNVGLVFQNHAVFPTMNVFENVAYGLRVRRKKETDIRQRVMHYLDLVGLSHLAHRMPAHLSGGQQQRVALARALVIEPTLLLLDEPLSHLDAKLRLDIRKEIRKIQQTLRITTIYVTHDQEEALSISDLVGVMNQGRLEQVAPPTTLYHQPANPFVASFIGEGTLLEGRLLQLEATHALVQVGPYRIRATKPQPDSSNPSLAPSDAVWVCIRPEAVLLDDAAGPLDDGHPSPNDGKTRDKAQPLTGTVEHVEFLGPMIRGELRVGALDSAVTFAMPTRNAQDIVTGQRLSFHLDPAAVSVGTIKHLRR